MKTTIITISKTEFEEINGKLYHKIIKREVINDYGKNLTPADEKILSLRDQKYTYREISEVLNAEGLRTRNNKTYHPGSIMNRLWYLKKGAA